MTKNHQYVFLFLLCFVAGIIEHKIWAQPTELFHSDNRVRSGISLGGIGTGSIELRKDGNFYNWSIFNNYPLGTGPYFKLPTAPGKKAEDGLMFFLVRYQVEGQKPQIKLLQLNNGLQEGGQDGIIYYYPWMSGVANIAYKARFPFVDMVFTDPQMPFVIKMEAFSPFIPHDTKNSSLPGVYFNFSIESLINQNIDVMLVGSLRNLVAYDEVSKSFDSELISTSQYKFFVHKVKGVDTSHPTYGTMGLGAIGGEEVSYYLGWEHKHPYYEKLLVNKKFPNIDDTPNRNVNYPEGLIGRFSGDDNDQRAFSSISVSKRLGSKGHFETTMFMNWYFPNSYGAVNNAYSRTLDERKKSDYTINLKITKPIGHYYATNFDSIRPLVDYFVTEHKDLAFRSHKFVNDMFGSDVDETVLNQINSHLNTFVSSSVFDKSGRFAIREGLTPDQSWGPNATMDVSLYGSPMIIALFPELQKSMMLSHLKLQTPDGEVNHGLGYDMDFNQNGTWGVFERVDLVPDFIQMTLRDYLWTNDKVYLEKVWPGVKKGIDYILTKKDLDGDQMPDMHGIMCSYDNFPMYGLASYIQSQWIAALKMASVVALDMNEPNLATKYSTIAQKGTQLMEDKLWNGSYYNLSNDYTGKKGVDTGCLTDQLIGQWVLSACGLGKIVDDNRIKLSLQNILKKSFVNHSFLRNCTWPEYPEMFPIEHSDLWVDQANTPWTGVELAFASLLIYENYLSEGEQLVKAIDKRYRDAGLYFDHQEFGGHYYRPMSAWTVLNAYAGLAINRDEIQFSPKLHTKNFKLFFVTPTGTGYLISTKGKFQINCLTGNINFSHLTLQVPSFKKRTYSVKLNGQVLTPSVSTTENGSELKIHQEVALTENAVLSIE